MMPNIAWKDTRARVFKLALPLPQACAQYEKVLEATRSCLHNHAPQANLSKGHDRQPLQTLIFKHVLPDGVK